MITWPQADSTFCLRLGRVSVLAPSPASPRISNIQFFPLVPPPLCADLPPCLSRALSIITGFFLLVSLSLRFTGEVRHWSPLRGWTVDLPRGWLAVGIGHVLQPSWNLGPSSRSNSLLCLFSSPRLNFSTLPKAPMAGWVGPEDRGLRDRWLEPCFLSSSWAHTTRLVGRFHFWASVLCMIGLAVNQGCPLGKVSGS